MCCRIKKQEHLLLTYLKLFILCYGFLTSKSYVREEEEKEKSMNSMYRCCSGNNLILSI